MAVELAKAYVTLVPSFQGAQGHIAKGLGDLGGAGGKGGRALGAGILSGFRSAIGPIAGIAAVAFGTRAIIDFGKAGIDALSRIETINAQTAAAIKSTGGAANVTAKDIFDLSRKLEGLTASEAESIQEGANLLLTFKNVRNEAGKGNDIFNQSTAVMVDMARAMGTDVAGGAIQLGKALNDPIAGIAALSRVGVTFDDDQKALIKTLVESGDVMGAQKVILEELNAQFGGSGAAYAETYAGKIDLLKDAFGGVQETVVAGLMPALGNMAESATTALNTISDSPLFGIITEKLGTLGEKAAGAFEGAATAIATMSESGGLPSFGEFLDKATANSPALAILRTVFEALAPVMPVIADAISQIAPDFADLVIALAPLIPPLTTLALELLPPLVDLLVDAAPAIGDFIESLAPVAAAIAPLISGTSDAVDILGIYATEGPGAAIQAALGMEGAFGDGARFAYDMGVSMGQTFLGIRTNIAQWSTQTISTIAGWVGSVVGSITGWSSQSTSAVVGWISRTSSAISGWVTSTAAQFTLWVSRVVAGFASWVSQTASAVTGWASRVTGAIAGFVSSALSRIASFWNSATSAFSSGVSRAVGFVAQLPGRALSALGNVGGILANSGRALVQGFINGILGMVGAVAGAVNRVVQAARDFFPNSPAKTGPFSGAGWRKLKESGGAIMDQFESGLRPVVVPLSASVGMAGYGSSRVYAPPPTGGYGAAPNISLRISNPVAEPTSETMRRTSQLIGAALAV